MAIVLQFLGLIFLGSLGDLEVYGLSPMSANDVNKRHETAAFRPAVQAMVSKFGGCSALKSKTVMIKCSHKLEKLTQGIDCSKKVPSGTVATFACPNNTFNADKHESVTCGVPTKKKWSGKVIKCKSSDHTSTSSTTMEQRSDTDASEETTSSETTESSTETTTTSVEQSHTSTTTLVTSTTTTPTIVTTSSTTTIDPNTTIPLTTTTTTTPTTTTPTTTTTTMTTTPPRTFLVPLNSTTKATTAATTTAAATTTMITTIPTTTTTSARTLITLTTTSIAVGRIPVPLGFQYMAGVGVIKIPSTLKTRREAVKDCESSGAVLMIPDTQGEIDFLTKYGNNASLYDGAYYTDSIFLGIHFDEVRGWVTQKGVVVSTVPLLKWCKYQPSLDMRCAVFDYTCGLTALNETCVETSNRSEPYVCEVVP